MSNSPCYQNSASPYPQALLEKVTYLAQFKQRPVTLQQLFDIGFSPADETLVTESQFLYQELPVRLAHRVKELESLPFGLSDMPSVRFVRGMYMDSIRDLTGFSRPETIEADRRFTRVLESIKNRHNNVVSIMARGILELKQSLGFQALNPQIQEFLDRFYMSRIGIRMLIGQHIALREPRRAGYVGLICEKCSAAEVANGAIEEARDLCRLHYSTSPKAGVFGSTGLTFTYVPSHLHHMMFELLKNSMRAVVEFHGLKGDALPMIRIVIAEGQEDVTLKVSDEGGGIPRSGIPQIWTYLYSTARPPPLENWPYENDFHAPLAGLGYGLPITRLYARYFGGDLQVISMEGYGTDAYLHLKRLGDAKEVLPRKLH
jgi:pyruvate dehydrogenase kinase 2/3/4